MFRNRRYKNPEERAAIKAANLARKAEQAKTVSHCQICDRLIQAKTGVIAHHGYERPGDGWQTASCMGARFRPYEVACDALPPAIAAVTAHIKHIQRVLADWQANPPQAIRCEREARDRRTAVTYQVEWMVIKPVDFDRSAPVGFENQAAWDSHPAPRYNYGFRPCDIRTYAAMYAARIAGFAHDIKASKETLAHFEKRLADWKPVGVKLVGEGVE